MNPPSKLPASSPGTPLRREVLGAFALLLAAALLFAAVGLLFVLPVLASPREALAYVMILLVADLVILSVFGGRLLRTRLVEPVEALVTDVRRIASGEYRHRVRPMDSAELRWIETSVNEMADRLIREQERLAENVESLDRTNRELVETRDQLVRSARLASVGTLAAGIAHEIGNPLSAIIGYVDLAHGRMEKDGGDPEVIEAIREEAVRIDRIVRGVLDYARPEAERAVTMHPKEVLERVRALLDGQGRLDGIADSWELDDPDVPEVFMEPRRLEHVMVNLLLNALDAMEGGPARSLRISLVVDVGDVARVPERRTDDPPGVNYMHRRRLSSEEPDRAVDTVFNADRVAVIRVEDDGPGIPPEILERIFDPFFTTKEPGAGTGLGLSICARLVEGMGGRIDVHNAEGGGAVFTVRLPAAPEEVG